MQTGVFLIQCPDQKGLVARVSSFFFERGFNIVSSQQHTEVATGRYFMRMTIDLHGLRGTRAELEAAFAEVAGPLAMQWSAHYPDQPQRVALLVTKVSHCLYDLLVRQQEGELPGEIPVIVSNHGDLEPVAVKFGVPFVALPMAAGGKAEQEAAVRAVLERERIDLVVLARYMQILSPAFVEAWAGRVINIHHAFLPAFQGARPYHQAYDRGVKMIGATAHYATSELDQGPIIEQDVARVSHEQTPEELSRIGRDIERVVLARAVKAHLEHRVIINGRRTVVFS